MAARLLDIAVSHSGREGIVSMLFNHGVGSSLINDKADSTSLHQAVRDNRKDLVQLLLSTARISMAEPLYTLQSITKTRA